MIIKGGSLFIKGESPFNVDMRAAMSGRTCIKGGSLFIKVESPGEQRCPAELA